MDEFKQYLLLMRWEEIYGERDNAQWYERRALEQAATLLGVSWPTEDEIRTARD